MTDEDGPLRHALDAALLVVRVSSAQRPPRLAPTGA